MPQKIKPKKIHRPAQHQDRQPGLEYKMKPPPRSQDPARPGSGRLQAKTALITGGDSGIGRAVAVAFAKEGAQVAVLYLNEHRDARKTRDLVESHGQACVLIAGDVARESFCRSAVRRAVRQLGGLDIVVNNAAVQFPRRRLEQITSKQLEKTFRVNIFSYFYVSKAALPYLKRGSAIINTTSVTAYRGSPYLVDYAATKGAIVGFTRSLAQLDFIQMGPAKRQV